MPECIEIEILVHYLKSNKLKNKKIHKIEIFSNKFKNKGFEKIKDCKIINIDSKGKQMWFELENNLYIMIHLGLTGMLKLCDNFDDKNIRLKMTILGKSTQFLCYIDSRNFGNLELYDETKFKNKISLLADDALKTEISDEYFKELIKNFLKKSKSRKNQIIYKILMNQNKNGLLSGLGNYLTAEILYDCKISPLRTIESLNDNDITNLLNSIKYITKLSYYNNITNYMSNFGDFIETHKKGIDDKIYPNYHESIKLKKTDKFVFKVYKQKNDPNGYDVIFDKSINSGRTVYWVSQIQK
jgi:formamidopyrimidine-DNA glycosylase